MITTVKEMAARNYGRTWTKDMLKKLVEKGNLGFTTDDYKEITNEDYVPTNTAV